MHVKAALDANVRGLILDHGETEIVEVRGTAFIGVARAFYFSRDRVYRYLRRQKGRQTISSRAVYDRDS